MDAVSLKAICKGLATYLPGFKSLRRREGGGANSARYCYSVWLRHLILLHRHGGMQFPQNVAELGPGDSLGVGLAALFSGVETYCALDVIDFSRNDQNLKLFEELLALFKAKSPIPGDDEFPKLFPRLPGYAFPSDILHDARLKSSLSEARIEEIKRAVSTPGKGKTPALISYSVPWDSEDVMMESSLDLIVSQAVLEHVEDLPRAYYCMHKWLRNGGYISNEIDFKSHGTAPSWDGHRRYSDMAWKLIKGNRVYLLNREPRSTHERLAVEAGFCVTKITAQTLAPVTPRESLAGRFQNLSDEDLCSASVYMIARKVGGKNG